MKSFSEEFLNKSTFTKVGYKEQCLEVIDDAINTKSRVDTLQLFYPNIRAEEITQTLKDKLDKIKKRGTNIEVFSNNKDEITAFLQPFSTIYTIKD